jgi:hypothetical protein
MDLAEEIGKKKKTVEELRQQAAAILGDNKRQSVRTADLLRKRRTRAAAKDVQIRDPADVERRIRNSADIYSFLSFYFPDVFWGDWTDQRKTMVKAILNAAKYGGDQAIAAPRGEGKTSIVQCVTIYCVMHGILTFPLIAAATGPNAEQILSNIKYQLERNELLASDYPEICDPILALEGTAQRGATQTANGSRTYLKWAQDYIILPTVRVPSHWDERLRPNESSLASGAVIATRGLDSAIRGILVGTKRPDLVIIDDPETRDSARSGSQTELRIRTIEQDLAGLGGPGKRLARVMLTTTPNSYSLSATYIDRTRKPSWKGQRMQFIVEWPKRKDLWDRYMEERQTNQNTGDDTARGANAFYLANYEAMNDGADVGNPARFISDAAPDETPLENSALQHAYNIIGDRGMEHFLTEYQNDPPVDDSIQQLYLTRYHIRANCRSGHDRGVVPEGTILVTCGADVRLAGLHVVTIAWNDSAVGSIIDFTFVPFEGTEDRPAAASERLVLNGLQTWWEGVLSHPWGELTDKEGEGWIPDLTLIDSGWKHKEWGTQPVNILAVQDGFRRILPCRGKSPFRPAARSRTCYLLDGINVKIEDGIWVAEVDVDAFKLKVQNGFLQPFGSVGSLGLYTPPIDESGRERWQRHQNFAGHILSEEWQKQPNGNYCWVPEGSRPGHKRSLRANHYLDATGYAIAARVIRGLKTIKAETNQPKPPRPPAQAWVPAASTSSWLPIRDH